MVLRFPDKVPLDDILPTFVDEALPLKVDYDENESVWDMIVKLCMFLWFICPSQSPLRSFRNDPTQFSHIAVSSNDLCSIYVFSPRGNHSNAEPSTADQAKNSTIQSLTPQIIRALASVLAPPEDQLSEARRTEVVQLVKYLHQQQPGLLQEYPGLTQTANA